MSKVFMVSDLHGSQSKYLKLFDQIKIDKPEAVFIAGDILPSGIKKFASSYVEEDFINSFMITKFSELKKEMGNQYPEFYLILGNDDAKIEEKLIGSEKAALYWHYINNSHTDYKNYKIFGYCYVPPTPFHLKDWEKYDVSRYTDPGCVSPEEGIRTAPVRKLEIRNTTIEKDLDILTEDQDLSNAIFLFHAPPYKTALDRAELDGKIIEHVQVDVHVGSIAIKRFIENRKPYITIHGHIHESSRMTGKWYEQIEDTHCYSASYEGQKLAIIKLELTDPGNATRTII